MKGETNYWEKEIIKIEVYWHMIEKYKELTKIHKSFKNISCCIKMFYMEKKIRIPDIIT